MSNEKLIPNKHNFIINRFANINIRQRSNDGYVSATDMCKVNANKNLSDFLKNKDTLEYLDALQADIKSNPKLDFSSLKLVEIYRGGNHPGTWIHPEVAIKLAGWISKEFEVKVNRWVLRFLYGDLTLINEIKINNEVMQKQLQEKETLLIESKQQINKLEKRQMKLESFVRNIQLLEKNQLFYLATTQNYAINNRFEFGGVKEAKELKSRFATYNTGRAQNDLFYVSKLFRCHNYKNIEERVHIILCQFKDKLNSRKEMVHLRYNLLVEIIDFICDNYDREIEYINAHCKQFLADTIEQDGIIPEELNVEEYLRDNMQITIYRRGREKTHRIDISKWDDAQLNQKIEEIINLCANKDKKVQYDFSTQKNSVSIELAWSLLTPYLKAYDGLTLTAWRVKFRDWFGKEKPSKLRIKGIKC